MGCRKAIQNGWHYVCAMLALHGGDWRNPDNMIACRKFKTRTEARERAANILNGNSPVNVAAVF